MNNTANEVAADEVVVGGEWFPLAGPAYGNLGQLMGPTTLLHMLESCSKVKQVNILDDYSLVQESPLRSKCCTACLKRLAKNLKAVR